MPFKSKAQEKFMFANHPAIAKQFAAETSKNMQNNLPQYSPQKPEAADHVRDDQATPDRKIEAMKMLVQQSAQQAKPAGQINLGIQQ